eukprot:GFUD01140359.1.p1 GENE.GFUD01140359.1~~GFUD01140359.1.p1  ORF type:complete len:160 (+),score=11.82 GFUD01140359.1:59-481(+)
MAFVQGSVGVVIGNCKYKCKANGGCKSKRGVPVWDWQRQRMRTAWLLVGSCDSDGLCESVSFFNECLDCKEAPLPCTILPPSGSCYSTWTPGSGPCPPFVNNGNGFAPVTVDFVDGSHEEEYCQEFKWDSHACNVLQTMR